jgi:pyruvate formate lyase activating enzyme
LNQLLIDAAMTGIIFNIKRFAVNDGPGIRTTVFLKGCPLRCLWCHNPESWSCKIQHSKKTLSFDGYEFSENEQIGTETSVAEVIYELEKERIVMEESGGGVTFSGGEPLSQPVFLVELLKNSMERGFHTAVDTSGMADSSVLEQIVPYTNLFLYDLKLMDETLHEKYTGVSNRQILENLTWLARQNAQIHIRIPLINRVTATDENLTKMADYLECIKEKVSRIDLLPYHRIGKSKYQKLEIPFEMEADNYSPDKEQLKSYVSFFQNKGFNVHTG